MIGGSIGLAVKRSRIAGEVTGVFRHKSTLKRALKCKAIDKGVMDIAEGVRCADLIIIASPVHFIPELARKVLKAAKPGAIVTDAGSTKGWIVGEIEKLSNSVRGVSFVGSHPMAGSERTGVEFARADLFEGAPCIVTKTVNTDRRALGKVAGFWKGIGSEVKIMTPSEHDSTVAFISHLPHLVAFALAGAVPEEALSSAAEGFRDTTRVASSDPELWADIFLSNRRAVAKSVSEFGKVFSELSGAISKGDRRSVVRILARSKRRRDKLAYAG